MLLGLRNLDVENAAWPYGTDKLLNPSEYFELCLFKNEGQLLLYKAARQIESDIAKQCGEHHSACICLAAI